jgi:multidrug efflux pump subunit AcrB
MDIVRFALKFPHTFYILAGMMLFLGGSAILVMPKDIFPAINIPVVTVIWQYAGLSPEEMEQRITTYSEYSISANVGNIRNIESQTYEGISVEKIFFQPNVSIDLAISQIVSATDSIRVVLPTGIQPPIIVQYTASSVPVLQLSLSSDTLNEQQLSDYGLYQVRQALAPIAGLTLPAPYGGKSRQIMVDIDPDALRANGITPNDVVNALNVQNLTLPAGDAKLGDQQFIVRANTLVPTLAALDRVPLKQAGPTTVHLSDVAHVHDGWLVQGNIVDAEGSRAVLLTIIKNGDASTLDVVNKVKAALPEIQRAAPPGMKVHLLFDQSVFVQQAIVSVLREGAIAAGLTALMILLFLGSWRSTIVVMVSILLSILTSLAVLSVLGQTIDIMTLGGLALSVGILVDNSTVTIENTHRLLEEKRPFDEAVLEGAAGIALPTLISTLAISCVFVSVFFLEGASRYLFTPLAMAVVFAMVTSYVLSLTLTPIIIRLLLRTERAAHGAEQGWLGRFHRRFNTAFDRLRDFYGWLLAGIMRRRVLKPLVAGAVVAGAAVMALFVGSDFFPQVDAGLIQLHIRAPPRTRIERTEQIFHEIEANIRRQIPPRDLGLILDNIGLPDQVYNLAFTDGATIGVNDGQMLIQLNEGHAPAADYMKKLRLELPAAFPDVQFYFQPADLVTQILNFGIPAQIDLQVQGRDRADNQGIARQLRDRLADIPGLADVHVQQELDAPELLYTVDRTRAQQLGLSVNDVVNNLSISLNSSKQVLPNFWTDPTYGITYFLAVQTPQYKVASMNDLDNTPIASTRIGREAVPGVLGNVGTEQRLSVQSVFNHSNIQPVYDVYASVQGRDLGSASAAIQNVVQDMRGKLGPADNIVVRGQIASMNDAFTDLAIGLLFAAVFVYALMVVNYQSFLDPLVIVLALPGAGSGIILMLFVTGTTFSVPSLMGAIMAVGSLQPTPFCSSPSRASSARPA